MICHKSDIDSKEKCVNSLKNGNIVIIPTDTVYGFSGIVTEDIDTDSKIKKIKGRDESKPFIQLISTPQEIYNFTDDIIPQQLLSYWPGPLTIIVNDKRLKDKSIKTTAFRCPGDQWLREIIAECELPLYSTSVNRSGNPVLENEDDIVSEFDKEVNLIVLDGNKNNALPSTIVSICNGEVKVLRQGAVKLN